MRCEWIAPESARWIEILENVPHDVYHLPSYAQLAGQTDGGRPGAFVIDDQDGQFLVPLTIRPTPGDRVDAISPYGYPSPIWSPTASSEFVRDAVAAFVETLRRDEIVSAFIRLHPILSTDLTPLSTFGVVVPGAETVYLDLTQTTDELWRDTRENHRRSIRRAEQSGFVARCDSTWERSSDFLLAYRETMARVDAADFYLFPDRYFVDLRAALGDRLHLLLVEHEDRVAAAALFTECCGIVQYHLGGTRDEFLRDAPMKLLFHFARGWFQERGARLLHLGGGVGSEQDSLFHFKAGFSSTRARFHTWRLITAPQVYEELVDGRGRERDSESHGTYFPAYREPR